MMVAIKARNEEEIKQVCKEYKITMWPSTIDWWLECWKGTSNYLCISIDEEGIQQGGGHICSLHELGSIKILNGEEGRRML